MVPEETYGQLPMSNQTKGAYMIARDTVLQQQSCEIKFDEQKWRKSLSWVYSEYMTN
jgi:hypothetical protein